MLPMRLRVQLRRWWMQRLYRRPYTRWPIDEQAANPPPGWPGWPGGKRFAFVLSHDVEGSIGFDQVKRLAELEIELGFRSSFNLVPEGEYSVSEELRGWLRSHDFEVGVHDLRHDGRLFRSEQSFRRGAERINHYLRQWDAVGFRSGFMFHNLEWTHELNIEYDASTFDCDPFEPQPDGMRTAFPFWVPAPVDSCGGNRGYVELPYTLAQDSTLFIYLKQGNIDTWKRKLDWVAKVGGMALVIVHPDYVWFDNGRRGKGYPVSFYRELLNYVKSHYGDEVWYATPAEVARFVKERGAWSHRRPKSVCMLAYSFYRSDNRIRHYAEALAERGDRVDVISLARNKQDLGITQINGVTVHSIQSRRKDERSVLTYLLRLTRFTLSSSAYLARLSLFGRYDVVHVHNIPDFLVFAAWFPKLLGTKVILDIHDIVPEFYASKFGMSSRSPVVRALLYVELLSARMADHVILSNHLWFDRFTKRSAPSSRCSVVVNRPDAKLFYPRAKTRHDGRFLLLFPGGLQSHQGLDVALRAMDLVRKQLPSAELHIYGDGSAKAQLIELKSQLGLDDCVFFHEPVPVDRVPELMANADLGIVPKRADTFGNEAYSTKVAEFMSVGVPVVVSNTQVDRFYFDDSMVRFFRSGSVSDLAEAVIKLALNAEQRKALVARALAYVACHQWEEAKGEYLLLLERLCSQGRAVAPASGPQAVTSKS